MATTFIAEAYGTTSAAIAGLERRAQAAAEQLTRAGKHVRYLHTIFVPEDETCFHLFEADSADVVRDASERASLGAYRIVAAAPPTTPHDQGGVR